nr:hypothetical protein BaRGS_012588 [Batillaria attramentaria]
MVYDFDVKTFCQNLRATKPPYECPIHDCGKVYKSFSGIQFHMYNYDHDSPDSPAQTPRSGSKPNKKKGAGSASSSNKWHHRQARRSPTPPEFFRSHARETLSYAESQRLVEINLEGRMHRIDIYEPLEIISQDEIDNQDNTEKEEKAEKSPQKSAKGAENGKARKENAATAAAGQPAKLPEAQFKVLDDYIKPGNVPTRPSSYYRYIEKSVDELDEEVEYDMDEEDHAWLELVNEKRLGEKVNVISQEVFETLMDRFEKEAFFQSQSSGKDQGQWLCRRCLQSPSRAVDCCLCPNKGGAFKQTDDGRWAHVLRLHQMALELQLQPFALLLRQTLDQLQEKDTDSIFAQPVSLEEVPDYLEYVDTPMDFSTMHSKVEGHEYRSFDEFQADFELIVNNCMTYNEKDTMYYKNAVKLKEQGGTIIRAAKKLAERVGFDMETGLPTCHKPPQHQEPDNLEDFASFMQDVRQSMPLEEQLQALLDKMETANTHLTGGRRAKFAKSIRKQIMCVRRKLSMQKRKMEAADAKSHDTGMPPIGDGPDGPDLAQRDSFKTYRIRNIRSSSESDSTSELSSGDESDSSTASSSNQSPSEPLDLVWAKCRGYPWYPALIINPKMPKTGYFHNGVPIPVPPDDVLELQRRQWLTRQKLEPLGVNSDLDKAKLMENKKPNVRKAVQKAYEKAIIHRCKVNGEPNPLSGDSSSEDI